MNVENQLRTYLKNCDEDLGLWSIHAMAEQLKEEGVKNIHEMDYGDLLDFLTEWEGKVVDHYGKMVDFNAAMSIADPEICEQINSYGTLSNQSYFNRYAKLHAKKYNGEEFAPFYHLPW